MSVRSVIRRFSLCFTPFSYIAVLLLQSTAVGQSQVIHDSILVDGRYRTFHYQQPAASPRPEWLLFMLHGSGGSGLGKMSETSSIQAIAASEKFIAVYPDGYLHFWNECRKSATSAANLENIDEGTFFRAMISKLSKRYGADSNSAVAIGFSGGGHMAYKLALTMPDKFKAVTAIVANLPDSSNMDCTESRVPVSVMIVNGTNDQVSPYNGGEIKAAGVTLGWVRSTDETFKYWSALAGYSGTPEKDMMPDNDTTNATTIERYRYRSQGKPEVTLLKMINGTHQDPKDLDIYLEAWQFLKRQLPSKH
jgi:polyhydroxybutyrate depolymerase